MKSSSPSGKISERIRERGLITVAAFMDLALYDPEIGYYARAPRRSGRAGDFFTSVDVGPLFGELLERQIAEMAGLLQSPVGSPQSSVGSPQSSVGSPQSLFDLVEAGAGDGRLAADILRAAHDRDSSFYDRIRLHLVEASAAARAAQRSTLGVFAERLERSADRLPDRFEGVIIANELLDAFPVHQVIVRDGRLREVYVDADLKTVEGPLSTPALSDYLERLGVTLEEGWRAEINLRAVDWIRQAARRLSRGFIVLIDYGHQARELYSATHSTGTLTSFARHTMAGSDHPGLTPAWLARPAEQDITSHVDFTSVRAAAESEGLTTIGFLDQTYFLLGILSSEGSVGSVGAVGSVGSVRSAGSGNEPRHPVVDKWCNSGRALKTLLMPGGLGSTHKVLILGKGVGSPPLRGRSFRVRVT
ncbi:MAG: SAM-dependent methyltransferase [Acidobacteria bacterium]|nr:SAM-dependent methyltransferase [Acidobacteriota bacterium]